MVTSDMLQTVTGAPLLAAESPTLDADPISL
jgi:hypothetical protein